MVWKNSRYYFGVSEARQVLNLKAARGKEIAGNRCCPSLSHFRESPLITDRATSLNKWPNDPSYPYRKCRKARIRRGANRIASQRGFIWDKKRNHLRCRFLRKL